MISTQAAPDARPGTLVPFARHSRTRFDGRAGAAPAVRLLVCTVCGTARVAETGATSRASSLAPTTGAAPGSATPHEAGRAGPVDAGRGRRRDARLLRPVQRRVAVARAR